MNRFWKSEVVPNRVRKAEFGIEMVALVGHRMLRQTRPADQMQSELKGNFPLSHGRELRMRAPS